MTFVLPTSHIPEKKVKEIEQKLTGATLCKGGFVSSFPQAVVFRPHQYGGIAMRPLATKQLVEQAKLF
jgi:hypothetical protein